MYVFRELGLWLISSLSILVLQAQAADDEFKQSSHVKHLPSCRLAAFDRENVTATEARCKYECLKGEQVCAAYQWQPETGTCQIQDSLHIVPSTAPGDEVGYMVSLKHAALPLICLTDCAEVLASDAASESGVYTIFVGGTTLKQVWCDMDSDGGGWTVFLKRFDGSVNFYRNHVTYKQGFGAADGEHWLGLDALHALTTSKTYALRVDVSDWTGASTFTLYESMSIGDESQDYVLSLGAFVGGGGGDCLLYNDGQRFSTYDRKLDLMDAHDCAVYHMGAWWYKACSTCHPTSKYYQGGSYSNANNDGMQWRSWSKHEGDHYYSMKTLMMKLRP